MPDTSILLAFLYAFLQMVEGVKYKSIFFHLNKTHELRKSLLFQLGLWPNFGLKGIWFQGKDRGSPEMPFFQAIHKILYFKI